MQEHLSTDEMEYQRKMWNVAKWNQSFYYKADGCFSYAQGVPCRKKGYCHFAHGAKEENWGRELKGLPAGTTLLEVHKRKADAIDSKYQANYGWVDHKDKGDKMYYDKFDYHKKTYGTYSTSSSNKDYENDWDKATGYGKDDWYKDTRSQSSWNASWDKKDVQQRKFKPSWYPAAKSRSRSRSQRRGSSTLAEETPLEEAIAVYQGCREERTMDIRLGWTCSSWVDQFEKLVEFSKKTQRGASSSELKVYCFCEKYETSVKAAKKQDAIWAHLWEKKHDGAHPSKQLMNVWHEATLANWIAEENRLAEFWPFR